MIREGDRVADYEIVARIKAGGMATLFLGRRTGASGFSKPVAVKVVHPHLAEDPSFVEMFVDEALLCARIQHPNVVHVEELRETQGTHLLVMEFVAGCSLSQLLRALAKLQRRMTPELAVHVAVAVLDGLHAAHELKNDQGVPMEVVHRDVSPDNVLLAWQGHVKLIDFGVAKAMSRRTQTTGSMLKGKIRYMSPEQASGKPVDRRTDVYALAIVLWECLTMRRLFPSKTSDFELIELVRNPTIEPPSRLVPSVPQELDAVLLKALSKNPDERYASARAMRRALAQAVPRAAALDGSDLSELLRAVMADEIESQRQRLAADAEALDVPVVERVNTGEPLRTTTISFSGVESASGLVSAEHSAVGQTAELREAAAAAAAAAQETTPAASARRRMAITYLGGALVLAGVAAGIALAVAGPAGSESVAAPVEPRPEGAAPAGGVAQSPSRWVDTSAQAPSAGTSPSDATGDDATGDDATGDDATGDTVAPLETSPAEGSPRTVRAPATEASSPAREPTGTAMRAASAALPQGSAMTAATKATMHRRSPTPMRRSTQLADDFGF